MMWRIKAPRRPGRGAGAGRDPQPRPRRPPAQHAVDAADRGGGRRPASSAGCASRSARRGTRPRPRASGSCCAARWPANRRARRSSRRCSPTSSTTGSRPAPPTAAARPACPLAIDTGKLIKAFRAQERTDARRARRRGRRPAAGRASSGRRGWGCGGGAASRGAGAPPARRRRGWRRKPVGAELVPRVAADHAPPAPAWLPATRRAGRGGRLHAGLHQPHLRQPTRRSEPRPPSARRWWTSPARAGLPLWIPADVAGNCCATPWSSKGYGRGHELMARRVAESLLAWTDGGRAAGGDGRQLLRAGPDEGGGASA